VGLALSYAAFLVLDRSNRAERSSHFQLAAEDRVSAIRADMEVNIQVLESVGALFAASDSVSRLEFKTFVAPLMAKHTEILALEWIPRVRDAQREAYEQQARAEGYEQFTFTENAGADELIECSPRAEHYPIYFVEPYERNERALGYDLATDLVRADAMMAARDSGQVTASAPVHLVQDDTGQYGMLFFLAQYDKAMPIDTVSQRRAAVTGYVAMVFRIPDFIQTAIDRLAPQAIAFTVYDAPPDGPRRHLYATAPTSPMHGADQVPASLATGSDHICVLDFAGRRVEVWCAAEPGLQPTGVSFYAVMVLVCGVAFTLFSSGYTLDRIRVADALQESQRRFTTLLANLPGMAYRCAVDDQWTMLFASEGCLNLTGYHSDELIGNQTISYDQLIHCDDREQVRWRINRAITANEPFQLEYRIQTAQGRERTVWEQGRLVGRGRDGRLILEGFITDVTERKHAERLQRERDSLQQATKTMEETLGVVGHELRTPLAGLRAMAEFLLDDADCSDGELHHMLKGIHAETLRMTDMVNTMLEAARLDSGVARWKWTQVHLDQVCNDALDVIRPLVDAARVKLICDVPASSATMFGDADAVRRLVLNLVSNAHKHTAQGSITVSVRRQADREANWIMIRVQDTGRGITRETAEKLGKAFATNRGAVQSDYRSGVGLGLAICRGIVAVHGGTISVASTTGQGTSFTVRLRADLPGPAEGGSVEIEHEAA
jgi:PAS domain S-box-containing protein